MISEKKTPIHHKVEQRVIRSLRSVKNEITTLYMMYSDEKIMREYVKEISSANITTPSLRSRNA